MHTKIMRYAALAVVSLLILSIGAGSAAASSGTQTKYQGTAQMTWQGNVPLSDLEFLMAYAEYLDIPDNVMAEISEVYESGGAAQVFFAATVQYCIVANENNGLSDVTFQLCGHGAVFVSIGDVVFELKMRCASLSGRVYETAVDGVSGFNMNLAISGMVNGKISENGFSKSFAFNPYIKIQVRNGDLTTWRISPAALSSVMPAPTGAEWDEMVTMFPTMVQFIWNEVLPSP